MDGFMTMIVTLNLLISLFSVIETVYKKRKYLKKYNNISKEFIFNLNSMENKIKSPKFEIILKNSGYDIKTKKYNDKIFKINRNRFMIYFYMNESCKFFSDIYNDKNIYCNLRINRNNDFYTVAHYRCQDTLSINDRVYFTQKNTDLININEKNFNKFIISNVDDFKKSNLFMIQNNILRNRSKAIISISLKDNENLIGVYTIYFSKPLDDKIKLIDLEFAIKTLRNKITALIKEYIDLNKDEYETENRMLIENKILE